MTGSEMIGSVWPGQKWWDLPVTKSGLGDGATRMEVTPSGRVEWRGNLALQDHALTGPVGVGQWDRRKQGLRVGVEWAPVQGVAVCDFDHPAQVHHGHAVRDVFDHCEVVGHEKQGQIEFILKFFEQIENLRLHRHVQCRDRLVGDDQPRPKNQGPGYPYPLALTARELMGKALGVVGVETHQFEHLGDAVLALVRRIDPMNS
jgi:hypothetical protein